MTQGTLDKHQCVLGGMTVRFATMSARVLHPHRVAARTSHLKTRPRRLFITAQTLSGSNPSTEKSDKQNACYEACFAHEVSPFGRNEVLSKAQHEAKFASCVLRHTSCRKALHIAQQFFTCRQANFIARALKLITQFQGSCMARLEGRPSASPLSRLAYCILTAKPLGPRT